MAFLQDLTDFLQTIFMSSSPEVKKRQALKKIEFDLRNLTPVVFKNGLVSENFAEALRQLYVNTRKIFIVLSETICNEDMKRSLQFTEQLLLTGFPPEIQEILEELSYENRKQNAKEAPSIPRQIENEHKMLEKVLKYLNTPDFVKIEKVIDRIRQLYDISKYNYITVLRLFDINFSSTPSYTPHFQAIPVDLLESSLRDLYYITVDMDVSTSTSNAIVALNELMLKGEYKKEDGEAILDSLKKIQSIIKHVITTPTLLNMIRLAKKDPELQPSKAGYNSNARQKYANYLEERFTTESARLKGELQDEKIRNELNAIFSDINLMPVSGYNADLNNLLIQSTPTAFEYVMPMQILKTFVSHYYDEHVKGVLNDIAIEGFFNNAAYKSEFSSDVYALNECSDNIKAFEAKFDRNGAFDASVLSSLIHDSHKDTVFLTRLKESVVKINRAAKDLIQTEVNNIFRVYKIIGEILIDFKKSGTGNIGNLRVLMMSSRNRDNTEAMEKQYNLWATFLEIMKNYVIITNIEKK